MKISAWKIIAAMLPAIIITSAVMTVAQEGPPAQNYKIKKVKVSGFDNQKSTSGWIVTGKTKSVVFAVDFHESSASRSIVSYKLSDRGKALSSVTPVLTGIQGESFISAI